MPNLRRVSGQQVPHSDAQGGMVDLPGQAGIGRQVTTMGRSICIISFSYIARDSRVLRQIESLLPHYELTVIGYGEAPESLTRNSPVRWLQLPRAEPRSVSVLMLRRMLLGLMCLSIMLHIPRFLLRRIFEAVYWRGSLRRAALEHAIQSECDAYHANDWTALPVAAEAARRHRARLIFDAHEYGPLEMENRWLWKLRYRSAIIYFLHKYASQVDAFTTVCEPIGGRYQQEFGLRPTIVYNAPKRLDLPDRRIDPSAIRLVHHGAAFRDRCLEKMILALAACDRRFSLHFILVPGHAGYIEELRELASRVAPGRVLFHPPVPPEQTAQAVAEYDMGFCLIEPSNYNNLMAAPNKFFDYIAAEMPVCIGPSPGMADVVHRYGLGCVASSFAPEAVAATLNALDVARLAAMQQGARRAAEIFHADAEMAKLVALYRALLPQDSQDGAHHRREERSPRGRVVSPGRTD